MGALDDAADLLLRLSSVLDNGHMFLQKQDIGEVIAGLALLGQPVVDEFSPELQEMIQLTDRLLALINKLNDDLKTASVLLRAGQSFKRG